MTTVLMESHAASKPQSAWKARGLSAAWASALGLVSGLACVGLRISFRMLQWVFVRRTGLLPDAAAHLVPLHRAMVPVLGAVLATTLLAAARRCSRSKDFSEYVDAVRFDDGLIPIWSTLWRTASLACSVASGAAAGREGSMIQFAAAVTSWCGGRFGKRHGSLARQVSYGVAAAVAAAYQAPLAGICFAMEIVLGEWTWAELIPLLFAAVAGWAVSRALLGGGPLFPASGWFSAAGVWCAFPLAVLLGALGPGYQKLLRSIAFLKLLPAPLVCGAAVVGLLSTIYPAVWGNGDVALLDTLTGRPMTSSVLALLLLRLIATTACVGTGTVGGVFTPTLFTGAALELTAGHLLHAPQPVLLAVVGMSAFLAAVTHAPWMATFMAVELTGQWQLLPLLLVLNLAAGGIARRLSPRSLYGIATPEPVMEIS